MQLKQYLSNLPPAEREAFAISVGTTAKHLTNAAYGYRPLDVKVCVSIESVSGGAVTRQDLKPNDWAQIWPELQVAVLHNTSVTHTDQSIGTVEHISS